MKNALIVSSGDKAKDFLTEFLSLNNFSNIVTVSTGAEARRILMEMSFEIVIINTPLSDEFGHELAILVASEYSFGIILIVKNENADEIAEKVENYGVFIIPRPISRQFFYQALKFVSVSTKKIVVLEYENNKLQNKIEEIRLVNRAKCVLMQYLNMTEPEAHRYIEKKAMDMRTTRKEISTDILKTYES